MVMVLGHVLFVFWGVLRHIWGKAGIAQPVRALKTDSREPWGGRPSGQFCREPIYPSASKQARERPGPLRADLAPRKEGRRKEGRKEERLAQLNKTDCLAQ